MLNRGKLVILLIVALAVLAGAFSTWYHYQHAHRSREFWGLDSAVLIAQAPEVELLRLTVPGGLPASDEALENAPLRQIQVGAERYAVPETREAAKARGMSNVRRALVVDTTFDWESTPVSQPHDWQYAIDFREGTRAARVLFDFDSGQVASGLGRPTALLDPAANADIREFFAEQFDLPKKP